MLGIVYAKVVLNDNCVKISYSCVIIGLFVPFKEKSDTDRRKSKNRIAIKYELCKNYGGTISKILQ